MNVVFMGTPDFAAESLKQLLSSKHTVSAVFAAGDQTAAVIRGGHQPQF